MKQLAKKVVMGAVVMGMLSSTTVMRPASARTHTGNVIIGAVAVGAVVSIFHHKHKKHTLAMAPVATAAPVR